MGAPYYGAYFATMALANSDYVAPLDNTSTAYAGYAFYQGQTLTKVLLYNSDYYANGTRPEQVFTLSNLPGSSVTAYRLTAASALSEQDEGGNPSISGIEFANATCAIQGELTPETTAVDGGLANFTVAASEALLIYL